MITQAEAPANAIQESIVSRTVSWNHMGVFAAPRRTAQLAATSVFGYGVVTVSDDAAVVGLAVAAVASMGVFGRDVLVSRLRLRRRAIEYVDLRLAAATPVRLAFADNRTEYRVVETAWIGWREETRRGLPRRFQRDFIQVDPARRSAVLGGRSITSSREAAAAGFEWDVHQLRRIGNGLRGSEAGERIGAAA